MNHLAIITSLIVSMIICSFIAGLVSIYIGTLSWVYPLTLAYSLEGIIKAWFLQEGITLLGILYLPSVAITYYMIVTNEETG